MDKRGIAAGVLLAVLATANLFVPDLGGGLLLDPTTIALGLVGLLALWSWLGDRRLGRPYAVLALVAVTFTPGLLTAAHHDYGVSKVIGLVATFAITAVSIQLLSDGLTRTVFVAGLGVLGVVVAAALLVFGESATYYGRASIFELNPIGLARMAALGALLAALVAVRVRGRLLAGAVVVALLCTFATYQTGSRGPAIAAVLAVAVALAWGRVHVGRRTIGAGVAAVILAGVAVWASGFRFDSSGRVQIWTESLALAIRTPLGIGFGDLNGKIPLPEWAAETGDKQYAHNVLIEAMSEGGWVALAGLLVALVVSLRWLLRDGTWFGRTLVALWVFAFANALVSSDLVGNRLMWVMICAGLAVEVRRRSQVDYLPTQPALETPDSLT